MRVLAKQTKGLWPALAELMLGAVDVDTDAESGPSAFCL